MAKPHTSDMVAETCETSVFNQKISSSFVSRLCFDIRRSIYEQAVVDLGLVLHIAAADVRAGRKNPKHFKQVLLPCIAGPEDHVGFERWISWRYTHMNCIVPFRWGLGGPFIHTGIVRAACQSWKKTALKPWNLISLLLS